MNSCSRTVHELSMSFLHKPFVLHECSETQFVNSSRTVNEFFFARVDVLSYRSQLVEKCTFSFPYIKCFHHHKDSNTSSTKYSS